MYVLYVTGEGQNFEQAEAEAAQLGIGAISTSVPYRYAPIIESLPCVIVEGGHPVQERFFAGIDVASFKAAVAELQAEEDAAEEQAEAVRLGEDPLASSEG